MSSVRLAVYVTPKSSREEIAGWRGGELAVRITAAPEGGKANAAVCKLVARELGVPKSNVDVVRGTTSRHKQLSVAAVSQEDLDGVFGTPDPGLF